MQILLPLPEKALSLSMTPPVDIFSLIFSCPVEFQPCPCRWDFLFWSHPVLLSLDFSLIHAYILVLLPFLSCLENVTVFACIYSSFHAYSHPFIVPSCFFHTGQPLCHVKGRSRKRLNACGAARWILPQSPKEDALVSSHYFQRPFLTSSCITSMLSLPLPVLFFWQLHSWYSCACPLDRYFKSVYFRYVQLW